MTGFSAVGVAKLIGERDALFRPGCNGFEDDTNVELLDSSAETLAERSNQDSRPKAFTP